MKTTTIMAIVGAGLGLALILYLAMRPRTAAQVPAGAGAPGGEEGSSPASLVGSIGTGLTAIAAGVADAAS